MSDQTDALIKALDAHKPDWWIRFSHQQDKYDLLVQAYSPFEQRFDQSQHLGATLYRKKRSTASNLTIVLRAALEAGLVVLPKEASDEPTKE